MKESRLSLAVLLAASLAAAGAAPPVLIADVAVSSTTHDQRPVSGGLLGEGKPLEMTLWGGAGAVAGSLAGPAGTVIGAGVGALCGLVYSVFVVPHNGPAQK